MPNHLHLLIFIKPNESINSLLANGKRFLAYEIVKRLEQQKQIAILNELSIAVTNKEKERNKKHRVFEVSSDIKPCYIKHFLLQKLNYMHANPVSGKWKLATLPEEYVHSSAAFYILNKPHDAVQITHYKDVGANVSHRPLKGDDAGH